MKNLYSTFILFVATLFFGEAIGNVASDNLITGLKVNQLDSPANIGEKASFSWMMVSDRKGAAQKAYRIRVSKDAFGDNQIWDSGIVQDDKSVGIAYEGEPLQCATRYRWSVAVKDDRGEWLESQSAIFETGLWGAEAWSSSKWISSVDARVHKCKKGVHNPDGQLVPEDGTDCFVKIVKNKKALASAWWTVAGLGVFEAYVNGITVSRLMLDGSQKRDFLKPGCTHNEKTKHSFTYDVSHLFKMGAGEENTLSAEVSSGWWRDKIANFQGEKSAFRAQLILRYEDGSEERIGTDTNWLSKVGGSVLRAGIFDGEDYDAHILDAWMKSLNDSDFKRDGFKHSVINNEFKGVIVPMEGEGVSLRRDLALKPIEAYIYKGVQLASSNAYGRVVRLRSYPDGKNIVINEGETLIIDFGQNAAAVPEFVGAAERGTHLNIRTAEMLNDCLGLKSRGNDGPEGSGYFENYRTARSSVNYIFKGDKQERYLPKFSFFGYRYLSVTATARVVLKSIYSIPVTSIAMGSETGSITTDNKLLNRLFKNALWGQYSNFLSIPTDCPQRNERLGWTADTQVFAPTAVYNANVYGFFCKWMRDMRDTQHQDGSYTAVAPKSQYGDDGHRLGWGDAGIIVPYVVWRQFGDTTIIKENWNSMNRYMALLDDMKYESAKSQYYQWADWLAYECVSKDPNHDQPEPDGHPHIWRNKITEWGFLGGSYWLKNSEMMSEMASAIGRKDDAQKYRKMAQRAREHIKRKFISPKDGQLLEVLRPMQTPALFAIKAGILSDDALKATKDRLLANIRDHGDCLQTGFLGTSILLDTLSDCGAVDVAYTLLLQRKNPSWLYSVDQGATTIWERWNSYTKAEGFGAAGMNSFNHYAYGCVVGWMYSHMAGIRSLPSSPGYKTFMLCPVVDHRVGSCFAEFNSPYGKIKSCWRIKGDKYEWSFTIPPNSSAWVITPSGNKEKYFAGAYHVVETLK